MHLQRKYKISDQDLAKLATQGSGGPPGDGRGGVGGSHPKEVGVHHHPVHLVAAVVGGATVNLAKSTVLGQITRTAKRATQ